MANEGIDLSDLGGVRSKPVQSSPIDLGDIGGSKIVATGQPIDLSDLGGSKIQPGQIDLTDIGGTKSIPQQLGQAASAAMAPFARAAELGPVGVLKSAAEGINQGGQALGKPVFAPITNAVEQGGMNFASDVSQWATEKGLPNGLAEFMGVAAGALPVATATMAPKSVAEAMAFVPGMAVGGVGGEAAKALAAGEVASKAASLMPEGLAQAAKVVPGTFSEVAAKTIPQYDPAIASAIPKTSNPVELAQWANEKQWYHGSGTPNLTPETMSTNMTKIEGMLGHGVYLTDNPEIAQSYAKVRSRSTGTPNVYSVSINTERILDMEQPVIPEIVSAIKSSMPSEISGEISQAALQPGAKMRDVWKTMNKALEDYSHSNEIPSSEFVSNFQELTAKLSDMGYDAMRYRGGIQMGGTQHNVLVILDPNREFTAYTKNGISANSVTRPNPISSMNQNFIRKILPQYDPATAHALALEQRQAQYAPEVAKASDEAVNNELMKLQRSKAPLDKQPPEIETLMGGNWLKARTQLLSSYAPIEGLFGKVQEIVGRVISPEKNPYIAVRNYAGVSGPINETYSLLTDILQPTQGLRQEMSDLFTARRSFERSVRGFPNPGGVDDKGALMAIEALRRKMSPEDFQSLETAAARIKTEITDPMLDRLLQSGVISQGGYKALKANNQMWAPFDVMERIQENADNMAYGHNSFQVANQAAIKSLKGTTKQMRDPMESLVTRIAQAESLAQRNEVMLKVANLADETSQPNRFVFHLKANEFPGRGYDRVSYFDKGIKKAIAVPSSVADALKGMNRVEADFITRGLGVWAQILRSGATVYNIPFALFSNPVRDLSTVGLTSTKGVGFMMDWVSGFASVVKQDAMLKAFKAAGGDQGMMASFSKSGQTLADIRAGGSIVKTALHGGPQGIANQLSERNFWQHAGKLVTSPLELIREAGEIFELTPRVGVFKMAIAQGKSPAEAAFMARNATVDFSNAGSALRVVNKIVPFLNARVQGTLNIYKTIKNSPTAAAAIIASHVIMPEVALYQWNTQPKYKKAYDDIPEYEKQNYFVIIIGNGWRLHEPTGRIIPDYIKIPRGDVGQYFGSPIRHFMDFATNNDPMSMGQIATQVGSDISPIGFSSGGNLDAGPFVGQTLPPPFRAAVQGIYNKNLGTGMPIIPPYMQKATDKSLMYDPGNTPETAITISKWLKSKVSPMMVDSFIKTTTAGLPYYFTEPGLLKKQIENKFRGTAGGAIAGKVYDAKAALEGDPANMTLRFSHALWEMNRDPKTAPAQMRVIKQEADRAARALIDDNTILSSLQSEVERMQLKNKIDPRMKALLSLTESELERYLAIKKGLVKPPPNYPNRTP